MRVMDDKKIFRHVWVTAGTSELWCDPGDAHSTYRSIEGPLLPEIGVENLQQHGPWVWPISEHESALVEDGCVLQMSEHGSADLTVVRNTVAKLGLRGSETLARLFEDSAFQSRILTCTGCYLELSEQLVPIPTRGDSGSDGYLLRFLHDSQCCYIWYLWLSPREPAGVVAAPYFYEKEYFDALQDEEAPVEYDKAFKEAVLCAHSLEEFLYRFWIENQIWYAQYRKLSLSPLMAGYLATAQANRRADVGGDTERGFEV